MKKALIYISAAAMFTTLLAPVASFGQAPELPVVDLSYQGLLNTINGIASILFAILVVLTVIFLIWAAWKYLNSDADGAKGMIINAAVAIAIGLLARGLPFLVRSLIPGAETYQIPS